MKTYLQRTLVGLTLWFSLILSACGSGEVDALPTLSVEAIQTLAVATFASELTQTAIAMPSHTPTSTLTPSPTSTSTVASTNTPGTPIVPGAGTLPATSCFSLAFVADVTIPDNTNVIPGQKFTKTWRVRNNGTCAWEAGFKFNFTGGDAMGGSTLTLKKAVNPRTETELSVALTAPNKSGSIQSNWRMTNSSGTYFGDEVYVLITVGGSASTSTVTATPSTTATPTTTGTPTETPEP